MVEGFYLQRYSLWLHAYCTWLGEAMQRSKGCNHFVKALAGSNCKA